MFKLQRILVGILSVLIAGGFFLPAASSVEAQDGKGVPVIVPDYLKNPTYSPPTLSTKGSDYEISLSGNKVEVAATTATLERFGGDATLAVSLKDFTPTTKTLITDGKATTSIVKAADPTTELNIYPLTKAQSGADFGGLEYEVILKAKPASNVVTFNIATKGIVFYYQGDLTPAEIVRGAVRPPNVLYSYAAYYSDPFVNYQGGVVYGTGKAFHIYRPLIADAKGNTVWGTLNIDAHAGAMTITVPQAWLDSAVFPVVVDPTFGFSGTPASFSGWAADYFAGGLYTSPSDVGTLTSISVYCRNTLDFLGAANLKGVMVLGSNANIIAGGVGGTSARITNAGWYTSTYSSPPAITGSTQYCLGFIETTAGQPADYGYDSGTNNMKYDSTNSYANPSNPTDWTNGTNTILGAYATYATGVSAPSCSTAAASDVAFTGTTGTVATMNGVLSSLGGAASVTIWFDWGYSTAYGSSAGNRSVAATGNYTAPLTGFNPTGTVHYRFAAQSTGGTTYGADQSFSTGGMVPAWYRLMTISPVLILSAALVRMGILGYLAQRAARRQGSFNIGFVVYGVLDLMLTFIVLGIIMAVTDGLW